MPQIALLEDQQILFKSLYGCLLFKDNKALYPKQQLRNYDRLCYRVALILITDQLRIAVIEKSFYDIKLCFDYTAF